MPFGLLMMIGQILRSYGGALSIAILVLQILVIISVLRGSGSTRHKLLWTIVILLLPVVGLILYALLGRSRRDRALLE